MRRCIILGLVAGIGARDGCMVRCTGAGERCMLGFGCK